MTRPNEKLAAALRALKRLQDKHSGVIESKDLSEPNRVLLLDAGFLRQVSKGWYVCANPLDAPGDTTAWYASYWAFLSGYLGKRFGKRYCLNVEASLLLHTASTTVPRQVAAVAKNSGNSVLEMPFGTSLLIYQDEARVSKNRIEVRGLQVIPLPETLCNVPPRLFLSNSREIEIAIAQIRDVSELLSTLLVGEGMQAAAGRLAGALYTMGRVSESERLIQTMASAGHKISRIDPFKALPNYMPTLGATRERSPYVLRLQSMWFNWRQDVLDIFPPAPKPPISIENYLHQVDERYVSDAYNSLSIEGYQVTDALIERVAKQGWNPEENTEDRTSRDAMAARGYYQAFQAVKQSLQSILTGEPAGKTIRRDHHIWFSELFGPAVLLGLIEKHQLAGYRTGPVFIRNSLHTPLPRDALLDSMEALFDLIEKEPEPAVRAVLGHHLFVFIHPYFDGNGRIGRFMFNALLASGGYSWTVVRVTSRSAYMQALEEASVKGDIKPLANFLKQEMIAWTPQKPTNNS